MTCACHLLFNAVNHLILVASQLIFEKTAWEICVSDLPLCEKAGHSQNLRVFIFRGIVLRGEHRIVELCVGDLMHQGSDGLNLAHALADAYFLAFGVESAVSVRGHFFECHRNRRRAFQGFHKGVILFHIAVQGRGEHRQRLTLCLGEIEHRRHPEPGNGDFLFLHDRVAVLVQQRRFGIRVKLCFLHLFLVDRRRNDLNAFLALFHVALKLFPLVETGDARGVRLLHIDEDRVVEGIAVKAAHGGKVVFKLTAVENIPDSTFDAVRDLFQTFLVALLRRVLCLLRDRHLLFNGLVVEITVKLFLFVGVAVGGIFSAIGVQPEQIAVLVRINTKAVFPRILKDRFRLPQAVGGEGSSACEDAAVFSVITQGIDYRIEFSLEVRRFQVRLVIVP